jgi:ketosteroid isomerase-like protein
MAQTAPVSDPKDMHAKFVALFNAGDVDGLMSLYEPEAVMNPSPGKEVRGTEAIGAALNGFLGLGGQIAIDTLVVFEGPGGIAMTHGAWKLTGGSMELSGKTAEVLRRQADGRWLYIIDNPWV